MLGVCKSSRLVPVITALSFSRYSHRDNTALIYQLKQKISISNQSIKSTWVLNVVDISYIPKLSDCSQLLACLVMDLQLPIMHCSRFVMRYS